VIHPRVLSKSSASWRPVPVSPQPISALLQSSLVHVNTLLLQAVLEVPAFHDSLDEVDRRGLSPLFWTQINPYGRFRLDMDTRLDLASGMTESVA
jgi:Tn3 transposase DDE domain